MLVVLQLFANVTEVLLRRRILFLHVGDRRFDELCSLSWMFMLHTFIYSLPPEGQQHFSDPAKTIRECRSTSSSVDDIRIQLCQVSKPDRLIPKVCRVCAKECAPAHGCNLMPITSTFLDNLRCGGFVAGPITQARG